MAPATAAARRSAAAHPARPRPRKAAAPARRVSGPAKGRGTAARASVAAPQPFVLRVGGAVHAVAEHRFLDRLIRGRAWIGILAGGLMGIVFLQVSMLQMNAGIGASVEKATKLERQNAALQAGISQLSSGERIQDIAARQGMVVPAGASGVRFLDARSLDVGRAVRGITAPSETPPAPLMAAAPGAPAGAPAAIGPAAAGATTTAPAATTAIAPPPATATTTPPPAAPAVAPQAAQTSPVAVAAGAAVAPGGTP